MVLSRHTQNRSIKGKLVEWDGRHRGDWTSELEGCDVLINLAGKSVNCRYNKKNQRMIKESRVDATNVLSDALDGLKTPPAIWLNASTATIYRHSLDKAMDEKNGDLGGDEPGAPPKWNFSIDVAKSWEEAFFAGSHPDTRKVALRSAMVMSPDRGGIFDTILSIVKVGLGGTNGKGNQYVSWIHETDFINAIQFIIDNDEIEGAVNVASPNPVTNREFMKDIRKSWGIPIGLPATKWMLEIGAIFMRTETELLLKSRRVVPGRLLDAGFKFTYPEWQEAAAELCKRSRGKSA